MMTLEENLQALTAWNDFLAERFPPDFYMNLALPWFLTVAPARARDYGTRPLFRYGVAGVSAQIFNCYWRVKADLDAKRPVKFDSLQDLFGFAVLLCILVGDQVSVGTFFAKLKELIEDEGWHSHNLLRWLETHAWDVSEHAKVDPIVSVYALALAYKTWEEVNA